MIAPCYQFENFSFTDMVTCVRELRHAGVGAFCMEDVTEAVVRYLYDRFRNPETGEREIALVRCFKTERYADLGDCYLQQIARTTGQCDSLDDDVRCLTLLGTAGQEPEWNERHQSRGHKAIPLVSKQFVLQLPMIARLIQQLGLEIESVLTPDPELLVDLDEESFNVFHVPEAPSSEYIPAQDEFVIPYGVQSVLGFGGMMPSGNLFAVIIFSKAKITRPIADRFKTISLSVKTALLPFDSGQIFREASLYAERKR
ncbi:MAG: hypothetical protein ACFB9N_15070 [Geitlerinemataceae cyanobacterium]